MRGRWGVLISGNGSTLQSLLNCLDQCDISVVISSKLSAYGTLRARRCGVAVEILPDHLKGAANKEAAESWILETLARYRVKNVFLAGYMKIVSPKFIQKYAGQIFNIHPSMLPKYRGLNSFQEALDAGETIAGVTVHHVVEQVDAGEFISQREVDVPGHRDSELSHLWLHINEQRLMHESLRRVSGAQVLLNFEARQRGSLVQNFSPKLTGTPIEEVAQKSGRNLSGEFE